MELFYQFFSNTAKTLLPGALGEVYSQAAASSSFTNPFLMYAIMGVTAFHLSIIRPSRKEHYRLLATSYQAKSLANFHNVLDYLDANNCVAVLVFSHQTGIQSFLDTFHSTSSEQHFGHFLDSLVSSIGVIRGIHAIIIPWWQTLLATEVGKIMMDTNYRNTSSEGRETHALSKLIEDAELTQGIRETYQECISGLQRHFNQQAHLSDEHLATPHTIFAWWMMAPPDFQRLLRERRPEALVVLAYYAVILHYRQKSWVIGNAGKTLVQGISLHLGSQWDRWLEWPQEQVLNG